MSERSDLDRATILFDLAHAMRSPMLTLLGFAELAQDSARDPAGAEDLQHALAAIERSALRLNRLVEDLVNLGRLQAPSPPLAPRALCLKQILTELTREAERTWDLGEVEISLEAETGEKMEVDERALRIAVGALLRNAVEATGERGRVILGLARLPEGAVITIENAGGGLDAITPRALERLFEAGVRGERHSNLPPGLGLGLTLARRSAEAIGARLELSSTKSGSTHARLHLPNESPGRPTGPISA